MSGCSCTGACRNGGSCAQRSVSAGEPYPMEIGRWLGITIVRSKGVTTTYVSPQARSGALKGMSHQWGAR